MKLFENKYKILWKTRFNDIFQFSRESDLLLKGNQSLAISTNNKQTALFLFALLNSPVSLLMLREMLKIPHESAYIVPITAIKQYIRIPKITDANAPIKREIIKQTEALLELEEARFLPAIDFDAQARIKAYMDDLVFALYFNVPIIKLGIDGAGAIRAVCAKNEFYGLINVSREEKQHGGPCC